MNSSLKFLNFSPNSSKINAPPLAESTAIGSPLSRQVQSNTKRKPTSPILSNISKQRPSNVKIDAHVITDAQSNGIVSRLVKYYDESNEPGRSNKTVYNKFGDYPLVQLKKTELKRPILRTTSVRIAPPNKTVMNPNVRAAIMRSNSFQLNSGLPKIVPTKMRAKDDSHKIITNHEPITDPNYPVSSKSVLDALEKNCRKRINNEELILDRTKKFCVPSEVVDSPTSREFIPISSVPQSAKRNREELSPNKSTAPSSSIDSPFNQQSKRIKTRNNALLSSLSSSHYDLIPSISSAILNNNTKPAPLQQKLSPKSKEVTKEMEKIKVTETKISEIRPKESVEPQRKKLQLFNAKPDKNAAINRAKLKEGNFDDDDDDEIKIRFVKPKEKVLENYDVINYVEKDKLNMMLKGLSQGIKSPVKETPSKDTVDSKVTQVEKQPVASISFTTSTTSSTIAPISTPASTSSAIISIHPISTNLSSEKKEGTVTNTTKSDSVSSSTTIPSLPKPTFGEGFQFGIKPLLSTSEAQKSTESSVSTSSLTVTSVSTTSMNIENKPVSPLALFSTPKVNPQLTAPIDQNKSLISFTPLKPTEPTTTTQSSIVLPTTLPTFGSSALGSTGFKFGSSNETKSDAIKPSTGFSFGSNVTNPVADKNEPNKVAGFSFGSSNNKNITASTSSSSAPTNTSSFAFGSSIPKLSTASVLPSVNPSQPVPVLNFQSPATTTAPSTFSFGGNSTTSAKPTGIAFGITSPLSSSTSNAPSFTKPETTVASGVGFSFGTNTNKTASSGFSFGGTNNQQPTIAPTTTASSGFSFGSSNNQPAVTQSTGIFSSMPTTTSASAFSFGSNTTNTAGSGFSGFGATPAKTEASSGPFSFGQKPQTAPVTTTNSGFGFGSTNNNPIQTALSAQPSQSSGFSFGQSTSSNNENKASGIFSRLGDKQSENKQFSFGGKINTPALQTGSSVPTFGSTNSIMATTSSSSTIFGSSTATNSVFGQSATLGNNTGNLFSSATNNNNNNNNQAASSPFGSSLQPTQTGNNLFAFGTSGSNNNNNNANQSQPSSGGIFGFSNTGNSSTNNNNNNNISNNTPISSSNSIFGSSNNNSGQNVSASFTFNTATGNVTSSQSQNNNPFGQNAAPPPYQFGSAASASNNVSASFTFPGPASAPAQSSQQQSSGPMFNFGSSSATIGSSGAFNFQGQNQTPAPQPSPVAGNLFNIGTGGNQQQRRPARVATRRYK